MKIGLKFKNMNIHKHNYKIKKEDRNDILNHKSPVIWLTGLSGSGKSTIANVLEYNLFDLGIKTYVLDGDNVRMGLNKDLGFTEEARNENIRRISEVSKLFSDSGTLTITAFISPFLNERENAKKIIGDDFIEVYVNSDIKTCEERDPKGLYKKARLGEIKNFTGIDSPYEKPSNPDIEINTSELTVEESVNIILDHLKNKGYINPIEEIKNLDKRKTLAIDFDGVIHKYSKGFKGLDNAYDEPTDGTKDALQKLKDRGYILKILSSRPKEVILPWLKKYELDSYIEEVSNHKFPATVYIDDRGYQFNDWYNTLIDLENHTKIRK